MNIFSTIYKRSKNLNKRLVPSKYPNDKNGRTFLLPVATSTISEKNIMILPKTFKLRITAALYQS